MVEEAIPIIALLALVLLVEQPQALAHGAAVINPNLLRISIIDMDDVLQTPYLEEACRRLSHGPGYGMNNSLNYYKKLLKERSVDACAIMAFYNGPVVGWLMYSYEDDCVSYRPKTDEAVAHIFVEQQWRRCGIGTKLLQMASRMAWPETLRVYPWEEREFFNPIMEQNTNLASI